MTLKDLVIRQQITGESDSELITEWVLSNEDPIKFIDLVVDLAKKKIINTERTLKGLVDNLHLYGATTSLVNNFGTAEGLSFDRICRKYIITEKLGKDFEQEYPEDMEWLRIFVPEHKQPFVFWYDFLVYLNNKGIYFKR